VGIQGVDGYCLGDCEMMEGLWIGREGYVYNARDIVSPGIVLNSGHRFSL
jgi:hypothetical protein